MNIYTQKLKQLDEQKKLIGEEILKDKSLHPYDKFEMLEKVYAIHPWIQYPFKRLVTETFRGTIPDENLQYIRPSYFYDKYTDRNEIIHYSSIIEQAIDDLHSVFDENGDKEFEDFTLEELNDPVIKLFVLDGRDYNFSFKVIFDTLEEFANETKTSGYTFDW